MADDEPDTNDDNEQEPELFPTEQKTVDASSVRVHRTRVKRQRLEVRQAEKFWQGVFSTAIGRREMWRLLQSCHTFEERFACGPNGFPQPEATWFQAGEQALGQRMYQTWIAQPDLRPNVLLMHDENDTRFKRPRTPEGGG
jgi:hypothetical protein